jgi:hypothetical protein
MRQTTTMVSASDIGMAAKCGHYLELKRMGVLPSKQATLARARGDEAHQTLNKVVEDKRCYVASHLYGEDHHVTDFLRHYRDHHLSRNWYGRAFIKVYYSLSPTLVTLSGRSAIIENLLSSMVSRIVISIQRKTEHE